MKKSVNFRFSSDFLDKVRSYAEASSLTMTAAIEFLCLRGLHADHNSMDNLALVSRVDRLESEVSALRLLVQPTTQPEPLQEPLQPEPTTYTRPLSAFPPKPKKRKSSKRQPEPIQEPTQPEPTQPTTRVPRRHEVDTVKLAAAKLAYPNVPDRIIARALSPSRSTMSLIKSLSEPT